MSDYKAHDFYDPEAVRQVETTNALQSHLELKYRQFRTYVESLPEGENEVALIKLQGYKLALDDLTHSSGTTLAHLYGEQKWRPKPEEGYEFGVTGYDDERPVTIVKTEEKALKAQSYWQKSHGVAGNIMRRTEGVEPGEWEKL